jgi:colanic acid biosynthesis glycosyl transferase WcaI
MRILVISGDYQPDDFYNGVYAAELCQYLAHTHEVMVITSFPKHRDFSIYEEYERKLFRREKIEAVEVGRCLTYRPRSRSPVQRILYDLSFAGSAFLNFFRFPRPDVVWCISPPLQVGLVGVFARLFLGVPFAFDVRDLLPDLAINLGILKNKTLIWCLHALESFIYRTASVVSVISPGYVANLIEKGVARDKIVYLPIWVDTERFPVLPKSNDFSREHGLADRFVVQYAGTIGAKQGLSTLLEAAKLLSAVSDIVFLVIGDGPAKPELLEYAAREKLRNVRFLPFQPLAKLPELQATSALSTVFQKISVRNEVFPCKILSIMAAGRPVLASVPRESEAARVILESGCGFIVEPENAEMLAQTILQAHGQRDLLELGRNGRRYLEEHFAASRVLPRFQTVLEAAATGVPPRAEAGLTS